MIQSSEITALSDTGLLGRRVLVVDEVAATRWSYVGLLRDAGARVTEARDGLEALAMARVDRPDVILADVTLPRLDGLGLCAALREEPGLDRVTVVLLSDGAPPQAVWGAEGASQPLLDGIMAVVGRRQTAPSPVDPEPPTERVKGPGVAGDFELGIDSVERENIRAQSTLAMHREPANHVPRGAAAVWRLGAGAAHDADGSASGFGAELRVMSGILGAGFIALVCGTVGLILWRSATPQVVSAPPRTEVTQRPSTEPELPPPPPLEQSPLAESLGLGAFSGELRSGVDPTVGVAAGQGVLALEGPGEVEVIVDGAQARALPVALPLDEGVHRVRYRFEDAVIDRFYYVGAGKTRTLRVITRPGGFVDAR